MGILLAVGGASAAPYGPTGKVLFRTQPDGQKIELRVLGDEHYARTETTDGYTVVRDKTTGAYHYAKRAEDGKTLVPTKMAVGAGNPATLGVAPHTDIDADAAAKLARSRQARWESAMNIRSRWSALKALANAADRPRRENGPAMAPASFPTVGSKVGLTLLIDFSDSPATISQPVINDFCNGENFTAYGNNGSVMKYYYENSNGNLTYTNVVTAYIRVPHPKRYYDDNTKDAGEQGNELVKDALDAMKALPNYNTVILPTFSNLTTEANRYVTACNVFYAGSVNSDWTMGLWPHSWNLQVVGPQSLGDGKTVNKYQITDIGAKLELGTFCHENGHMLCGYPDIYDYDYDSKGGAGMFCLMNSGAQGGNPTNICAYLKYVSGWATITTVSPETKAEVSLHSTYGQPLYNHFYRMEKPGSGGTEYFIIENRNRSARDAIIPDSGIAIWHVDELGDHNNQSLTSNSSHQNYEVTLEQADGKWHFQYNINDGDANDLFSGSLAFTDSTTPNAHWWNGSISGMDANSFSAPGTAMTLKFGLVLPPNTIDIISPNGGELRYWGSTYSIRWNTNVLGNVKIELLKGGAVRSVLAESIPNGGEIVWVPAADLPPGGDYRIRITSVDNPAWTDTSTGDFTVAAAPPYITSPLVAMGVVGQPFTYQITASNSATNLVAVGLPTGLSGDAAGLITGTPGTAGTFYVSLSATNPLGTAKRTLRLMIDPVVLSLTEALDSPALEWTTGGATGWFSQVPPGSTYDGIDGSQSRTMDNDEENWMETTVYGPGIVTFWWAVSSEATDKLRFTMDGIEVTTGDNAVPPISGLRPWAKKTKAIPPGIHKLRWTYRKDHTVAGGLDAAWVDQVEFALVPHVPEINVAQPIGNPLADGTNTINFGSVIVGSSATRDFTITNTGSKELNLGDITFSGTHADAYSVSVSPGTIIEPGATTSFTVKLQPSIDGPQPAVMHIASDDPDENPFDVNLTGLVASKQEYPGTLIKVPKVGFSQGDSDPYPATVNVAGVTGNIVAVKLKLNGFFHGFCDDIDMYLMSPNGKFCTIMSDAGGGGLTTARNLVFEDIAATKIPDAGLPTNTDSFRPGDYANSGGTNNPSQYDYSRPGDTEVFTLNELAEGDVNGAWQLYVFDDASTSRGDITTWALVVETANPEIEVEHPVGTGLADGTAVINLGNVPYGSTSSDLTVTVKNTGNAPLTGLEVTVDGAAAGDFSVGALGATTLAEGTSTTFTVGFTPSTVGERTGTIHIASNDASENPFDITLSGTGLGTALESWRMTNFGSPDNTGDGADLNDFDKDGIANLIEYAFALDPQTNSAGKLPVPIASDGNFVLSFSEPAGASGVTYAAEWSPSLQTGAWTPLTDTGSAPTHTFSVPMAGKEKVFMRIRVSNPAP